MLFPILYQCSKHNQARWSKAKKLKLKPPEVGQKSPAPPVAGYRTTGNGKLWLKGLVESG